MLKMFQYNWQIREEWFAWCQQISAEELLRQRSGGVGSILRTLYHIIDVEWSWIQIIQGKPDDQVPFEEYMSLERIKELSASFHEEVEPFLSIWTDEMDGARIIDPSDQKEYTAGEILRHVIAHEIHHIGQLSVWSRELGLAPISPNFIGRGIR